MTESSNHLRIFFAITPPEEIHQSLISLIQVLRKKYPTVKWTRQENLHITLQFLASVREQDIELLTENVHKEINSTSSFQIHFEKLELFPTIYRPSVVSLSASPNDTQADLARLIGKGIEATGYEIEHRAFRSHLTLARLDRNFKVMFDFSQFEIPAPSFLVDEITLYKSELSRQGSIYSKIHVFKLA